MIIEFVSTFREEMSTSKAFRDTLMESYYIHKLNWSLKLSKFDHYETIIFTYWLKKKKQNICQNLEKN